MSNGLAFHNGLGIDHFYIYDNGSSDSTRQILERLAARRLVEFIDWPEHPGQLSSYLHALETYGARHSWMGFIDLDEFIVPVDIDDVAAWLNGFPLSR